ncbi:MAG: hypothetical protein JWM19_4991 [Actinomycetia bacterium]|nr:hypothetical protein [Actinomycetes bacterium]
MVAESDAASARPSTFPTRHGPRDHNSMIVIGVLAHGHGVAGQLAGDLGVSHVGFSVAMRITSLRITAAVDGLPGRRRLV